MKPGLDNWVDIIVVIIYFALVLVVGLLSACRKERGTVKGYFLAGRSMTWLPIGASLFASNIGSEHFIGLAGSGAASGIAVVAFEWGAALCLPLLGWVFLPVYLTSKLFTIPEYLSKRFGGNRLRIYLSLLALFLYIVTKISVDIYAGAVFVQQALGWNTYIAIVALLAITAVYTIAGGLAAVIFTDTLQTVIMLVGAIILSIMGFVKVGGLPGLMAKYFEAIPDTLVNRSLYSNYSNGSVASTCGMPRPDAFHILRDPVNSDLPWPGVLIRSTFVSTWYWCADQVIVQRALAAKNIGHARGATLMAGYLKFLPLFLIIMPGMISRVLYPEYVACADPETCMSVCENPVGCSNVAYPRLILGLAPIGMRGLMIAVMMAALMSSLTSIFNSAATLVTMDLWRKVRKQATERELLIVGKVFVLILVGVSVAWIPLIQAAQQGQLFLYIQAVTGYLAPPICSVFLLAVFVPRVNEQGAFWGMLIGQIIGLVRMVLDFVYPAPKCGDPDTRPAVVSKVNFTYFAALVLFLTAILVVIISFITKAPKKSQVKGLTFWTMKRIGPKPASAGHVPIKKSLENETKVFATEDPQIEVKNEKKTFSPHGYEEVSQVNTGNDVITPEFPEQTGNNQAEGKQENRDSKEDDKVPKRRPEFDDSSRNISKKPGDFENAPPKPPDYNSLGTDVLVSPVVLRQKTIERIPYVSDESRVLEVYGIGKRNSDKVEENFEMNDFHPTQESVEHRNKIIRVKRSSYAADMSLVIHNELTRRKSIPPKVKPKPSLKRRDSGNKLPEEDDDSKREQMEDDTASGLKPEAKEISNEPEPEVVQMQKAEDAAENDRSETTSEKENPMPESDRNGLDFRRENSEDSLKLNPLYVPMEEVKRPRKSTKKIPAPPPPVEEKLYISSKLNIFLNVNAIILICVFVFLYCIFH